MATLRVEVNGVRLAFSVGPAPGAVPGEPPQPPLLVLRGGPEPDATGWDLGAALPRPAEVVRLDQRGGGASETGRPGLLHLEQWAWDLRVFCAAVGVERPVVVAAGANGAVALLYAARSRAHPAGLVLHEPLWEPERLGAWLLPDRKALDLAAELARVACPVLVIASSAGEAVRARALAELLPPLACVEPLPGPDAAAARVLTEAFLARLV